MTRADARQALRSPDDAAFGRKAPLVLAILAAALGGAAIVAALALAAWRGGNPLLAATALLAVAAFLLPFLPLLRPRRGAFLGLALDRVVRDVLAGWLLPDPGVPDSAHQRLRQAARIDRQRRRFRRLGLALRRLGEGWVLVDRRGRVRLLRRP